MNDEVPELNPPLSPEEKVAVEALTQSDIEFLDTTILAIVRPRWQKVAMVVSRTDKELKASYPQLSYIFYAMRIKTLADQGKLEAKGNLGYMRFSEVRLPEDD